MYWDSCWDGETQFDFIGGLVHCCSVNFRHHHARLTAPIDRQPSISVLVVLRSVCRPLSSVFLPSSMCKWYKFRFIFIICNINIYTRYVWIRVVCCAECVMLSVSGRRHHFMKWNEIAANVQSHSTQSQMRRWHVLGRKRINQNITEWRSSSSGARINHTPKIQERTRTKMLL